MWSHRRQRLHSQLYSRAIKAACLGKTGEKLYPSINTKPLSMMIALVMKHFFSCQKYPYLIIFLFRHEPPLRTYGIFLTQWFVFSRLQMNISFGTRTYCRNYTSEYRRNLKKKRNRAAKMATCRPIYRAVKVKGVWWSVFPSWCCHVGQQTNDWASFSPLILMLVGKRVLVC